ncbi:diguanylate cyclase domain-containing protein [Sphingomonas sp. MMS12-HWE2-04]|uniref:diguanylate cyclase domain-containing protein n=1 Tax=Sphingomonas sp. MMS12-HWE2-04 TaxID=3234199 RepID=UPI00384FC797
MKFSLRAGSMPASASKRPKGAAVPQRKTLGRMGDRPREFTGGGYRTRIKVGTAEYRAMRRSDLLSLQKSVRRSRAARAVPEPVYRQLIDILFGMTLPVFGLAIAFLAVGILAAIATRDWTIIGLLVMGGVVTAGRLLTFVAYHRDPAPGRLALRRWERRYAVGSYAFALLLAGFNLRLLCYHEPLLHLLSVSLVFGYGAGIVARISVRPVICVTSLALAIAPTIAGLFAHAFSDPVAPMHLELYLLEALLLTVIVALSLQTVGHLYRATIRHLTSEHDFACLAKRDPLTNLANRLLLRERFDESCAAAARAGSQVAVHCIDLDGFKPVNDTHGHPVGDAVLREVAARLADAVRAQDCVARVGGDEFVVVQAEVRHGSEAELLARRLIGAIRAPYRIGERTIRISASIGIAVLHDVNADLEQTLTRADAALYRAKSGGKSRARLAPATSGLDQRHAAA